MMKGFFFQPSPCEDRKRAVASGRNKGGKKKRKRDDATVTQLSDNKAPGPRREVLNTGLTHCLPEAFSFFVVLARGEHARHTNRCSLGRQESLPSGVSAAAQEVTLLIS